jgi:site-specific DNA-methyltransferase (adenine-specific)
MEKIKVNYKCKKINVEQLSDNKFKIPDFVKELDGSYGGNQVKPAVEIIMVVMKPLSESTYVDQALANGKGITRLDNGRIPYQSNKDIENATPFSPDNINVSMFGGSGDRGDSRPNQQGRFPANLLVSDDVLNDGNVTVCHPHRRRKEHSVGGLLSTFNVSAGENFTNISDSGSFSRYFDLDAWMNEQIKQLPKEAQTTFPFLITPKASKSEKGDNCTHPTVKPVKLISWLITIGSQKNDLVLDPFLGSGTTLEAGRFTGRRVLGFEISDEWEHLYRARCMAHQPPLSNYV